MYPGVGTTSVRGRDDSSAVLGDIRFPFVLTLSSLLQRLRPEVTVSIGIVVGRDRSGRRRIFALAVWRRRFPPCSVVLSRAHGRVHPATVWYVSGHHQFLLCDSHSSDVAGP